MDSLIKAPAKLTLSFKIVGLREDGYHLIKAEMVTVDLCDELRIQQAKQSSLELLNAADDVPSGSENTVLSALQVLDVKANVTLNKKIPSQAGLGGGSADAAAIFKWVGCDDLSLASQIGADVPFCLVGGRALVEGIGEIITPLTFEQKYFTLLTPDDVQSSTAAVYKRWDELNAQGFDTDYVNDLEPAVLDLYPKMNYWKEHLESITGQPAYLAGSGSTWFVNGSFPGDNRIVVKTCR